MRISWTHGLMLMAALQGAILVSTFGREAASKSGGFLETGDHLDGLVLTSVAADRLVLPGGEDVLILTYDPDCGFSREMIGMWEAWASEAGGSLPTLLVSSQTDSPIDQAESVAGDGLEVWALAENGDGRLAGDLFRRVPWVFLVDSSGQIQDEGHGHRVAEIAGDRGDDLPSGTPNCGWGSLFPSSAQSIFGDKFCDLNGPGCWGFGR